jgi:hypothetical protein
MAITIEHLGDCLEMPNNIIALEQIKDCFEGKLTRQNIKAKLKALTPCIKDKEKLRILANCLEDKLKEHEINLEKFTKYLQSFGINNAGYLAENWETERENLFGRIPDEVYNKIEAAYKEYKSNF